MPKEIYLVKVGMTMTEGMVSEWYIPDGSPVKKGELLYALETEKVTLDVDADDDGIVKHGLAAGVSAKPGDVIGYIYEAGENIDAAPAATPVASTNENTADSSASDLRATSTARAPQEKRVPGERIKSSPAARRLARELNVDYTQLTGTGPGGRIVEADVQAASAANPGAAVSQDEVKASPLAKRLAAERGIDLASISGTGPGGRIVQSDVDAVAGNRSAAPAVVQQAQPQDERIPLRGMRKTIASRMHNSLQQSAQLTMNMEVIMDDAVKVRAGLIEEWADDAVKPSYTDFVIAAVAKALTKHRMMNSHFTETDIVLRGEVNVGMAVALADGLVVPVIRAANQLSLKQLAQESSRLALAARDGKLGLDDYADGTFTVSTLGMYGVDSFTPIVNEGQSGILGVNRLYDGVEWDGDTPVKTKKMNLSLTWDHRILDGAPAAEFLREVRDLLAAPWRLLV